MSRGILGNPALSQTMQDETMLQDEEVAAMVRLHELGWGAKRLAREFGCARNTVRRYLREGGPAPFASRSGGRRSMVWTIAASPMPSLYPHRPAKPVTAPELQRMLSGQ